MLELCTDTIFLASTTLRYAKKHLKVPVHPTVISTLDTAIFGLFLVRGAQYVTQKLKKT